MAVLPDVLAARLERRGLGVGQMVATLVALTRGDPAESATIARTYQQMFSDVPDVDRRVKLEAQFRAEFAADAGKLSVLVNRTWDAACREALPLPIQGFLDETCGTRRRLEELASRRKLFQTPEGRSDGICESARKLAPSYMHMTNNRLGLSRRTEAYLGYVLAEALSTRPPTP